MNTFLFHGNYNSEIQQAILRNLNQLHTYICWKQNISTGCTLQGTSTAVWTSSQLFYYTSASDTTSHYADLVLKSYSDCSVPNTGTFGAAALCTAASLKGMRKTGNAGGAK